MTKLLVRAKSKEEIDFACSSGADIVELVATDDKLVALMAFAKKAIEAAQQKGQKIHLSVPYVQNIQKIFTHRNGENWRDLVDLIYLPASFSSTAFLLPPFPDEIRQDFFALAAQEKKWMMVLDWPCSSNQWAAYLPTWQGEGIGTIMLESKQHLLSSSTLVELGNFIERAQACGLMVALSGLLEPPDIPRLLRLAPDILCFARDDKTAHDYFTTASLRDMISDLIAGKNQQSNRLKKENLGTDRLIVRDFILPVEIGAYHHEHGKKQRVRFNVFADVARLSDDPHDMRHIISYDLIMDAIRQLVAGGHVDLVETLAEQIAASILAHGSIRRVVVRVEKLDLEPEAVGVEIERFKP